MIGPWSTWTWRDPATIEQWGEFYPLALEELNGCRRCTGQLIYPCTDPTHLGFRNPQVLAATTCEDAARAWLQRIDQSFLATHPDIDSVTRRYVEAGRVEPALNADTVVEQARLAQEKDSLVEAENKAREATRQEGERRHEEKEEKERARRAKQNPYCLTFAKGVGQLNPCISVDSESRLGWHGHALNEPVDMDVCLIGRSEPFDFRLVDPRTGATTLLSLEAVSGFAVAPTPSGECQATVKVLLTPNEVEFIGDLRREDNNFYSGVSVRVHGTYQGLYSRQASAMEPSLLLIQATRLQRPAPR